MTSKLDLPLPPTTAALPSDKQITEAYARFESVWAAGLALGIAGQTVHKRMKKAGLHVRPIRTLTDEEAKRIRSYYENTPADKFCLDTLADSLGRPKTSICKYAREMGLTKHRPHSSEVRARQAKTMAEKWKHRPHPRGALGMTHSLESREKISAALKRTWADSKAFGIIHMAPEARQARRLRMSALRALRPSSSDHTRAKGGRRDDLGDTWFRSSWEANYARYLNLLMRMKLVTEWSYEPETFWFNGVRRGCVSYRPDFRVIYKNDPIPEYIELKGWVTPKDRTKWRRMAKYHPHIKLVVIAAKEYRQLEGKWRGSIPEWESGWKKAAYTRLLGKEAAL